MKFFVEQALKLVTSGFAGIFGKAAGDVDALGGKIGRTAGGGLRGAMGGLLTTIRASGGLMTALGRTGLVAAVGVLSYELTSHLLKWTGLDKKIKEVAGTAADFVSKHHVL